MHCCHRSKKYRSVISSQGQVPFAKSEGLTIIKGVDQFAVISCPLLSQHSSCVHSQLVMLDLDLM